MNSRRSMLRMFGLGGVLAAAPVVALGSRASEVPPEAELTYRAEKGRPLSADEVDGNFRAIAERVRRLEKRS